MKEEDEAFFYDEGSNMSSKQPDQPIRFYSFPYSGHCHRVALLLSELELPHETINVDLANKAHKSEAFLAMNAFGQVPVIQDGDVTIADSLAILTYLPSVTVPDGGHRAPRLKPPKSSDGSHWPPGLWHLVRRQRAPASSSMRRLTWLAHRRAASHYSK